MSFKHYSYVSFIYEFTTTHAAQIGDEVLAAWIIFSLQIEFLKLMRTSWLGMSVNFNKCIACCFARQHGGPSLPSMNMEGPVCTVQ